MQHLVELRVSHHAQDVRMAADKKAGWISTYSFIHCSIVLARIASDVRHPDIHTLALEAVVFRVFGTHGSVVNISIDPPQRLEICQLRRDIGTEITCVPNLVALRKVVEYQRIQESVRVGDEANSLHGLLDEVFKVWNSASDCRKVFELAIFSYRFVVVNDGRRCYCAGGQLFRDVPKIDKAQRVAANAGTFIRKIVGRSSTGKMLGSID